MATGSRRKKRRHCELKIIKAYKGHLRYEESRLVPIMFKSCVDPLTPAEVEFIAEQNTMIQVIPFTRYGIIHCIQGDYGPFKAQQPAEVPLWLALALKATGLFRLNPPAWLSKEWLNECLRQEREQGDQYQPIPHHWLEIGLMILEEAADDVPHAELVRRSIQAIRECRLAKTQKGIEEILKGDPIGVKRSFISSL